MSMEAAATGVAFLFQVTGAAVIALVAGETTNGGVQLDPALAAAYGAIGALFGLVTWLAKGRIERCEKREDTMLTADTEKTTTLRELVAATGRAADVTAQAVAAGTGAIEESRRNGQRLEANGAKLDALIASMGNVANLLAETSRKLDRMAEK